MMDPEPVGMAPRRDSTGPGPASLTKADPDGVRSSSLLSDGVMGERGRRLARRVSVTCYFVVLALASQFEVVAGGRDGSPSAFFADLSFRSPARPAPLLDAASGYIQQAVGPLGVSLLKHGHSPWWNPYAGLGFPLAQDFQSAVFYPVSLVVDWFHLGTGRVDLVTLADIVIAGVGAYWLARALGLRLRAGIVAGTAFALAGSFVWFGTLFGNVMAWAPVSLALTWRLLQSGGRSRRDIVLLGVVTAVQILGGFPESLLLQGLLLTLPLGVAALIRFRERRLRAALALVEGFALGLAASAFLWVPFLTALSAEDNWNGPGTALLHLPRWADLTLFVPFGFGHWFNPRSLTVVQWYQLGGYLGVVAAWLALSGLIGGWRRRPWLVAPLSVSVLVAMGWMNGLPPFNWIGGLPGITQVALGRLAVSELELAVAVLAALAVDLLVGWRACVGATIVGGGAIWLLVGEAPAGVAGGDLVFVVACLGVVAIGFPVLTTLARSARGTSTHRLFELGATALVVVVLGGELLTLSNMDWSGLPSPHAVATPTWVTYVQDHLGGGLGAGRLYSADGLMQPSYSGEYGFADLSFEDGVVPRDEATFVQSEVEPTNDNALAFIGSPMQGTVPSHLIGLELAGVTLLALPDPGCAPACSGLSLRFDDRAAGVGIFSVPDPQPFLWFPAHVVRRGGVPAKPLLVASVASASSGGLPVTALRSSPGHAAVRAAPAAELNARLVSASGDNSRLVIAVHADRRRLLVAREAAFPGWRATIDGRRVAEVTVDGVFQGVMVPSGTSRVVLTYRPVGLSKAEALSFAAVVWAALSSVAAFVRRRGAPRTRRGRHSESLRGS